MDPRKRSNIVLLTLLGVPGAIAVANSFPVEDLRRNLYPDRAACERDYSAQQCEQSSGTSGSSHGGSSGSRTGGGYYHGPYYYADRNSVGARGDPGTGRTGQVTATQTSMRGGFGSVGRAFSGGS